MTEEKFTSGIWYQAERHTSGIPIKVRDRVTRRGNVSIATFAISNSIPKAEAQANIDLFLAAPKLLNSLINCVASLEFLTAGFPKHSPEAHRIAQARAAILEARGEYRNAS